MIFYRDTYKEDSLESRDIQRERNGILDRSNEIQQERNDMIFEMLDEKAKERIIKKKRTKSKTYANGS